MRSSNSENNGWRNKSNNKETNVANRTGSDSRDRTPKDSDDHAEQASVNDEAVPELPFKEVPPVTQAARKNLHEKDNAKKEREGIPENRKGPSYQMKAPIENDNSAKEILDKLMRAPLTWDVEDLLAASEPVSKELIKLIAKKRVAPKVDINTLEEFSERETIDAMPFESREEDEGEPYLRSDAISINDLPPASVLLATDRQIGNIPAGALMRPVRK